VRFSPDFRVVVVAQRMFVWNFDDGGVDDLCDLFHSIVIAAAEDKVGFTEMERWICFSAVKNNLVDAAKKFRDTGVAESAASGEADMYSVHRKKLELVLGEKAQLQEPVMKVFLPFPICVFLVSRCVFCFFV
jgi:hypothetical protein